MAESTSHASSGDIDSNGDDRDEASTSSDSSSDESGEDDHRNESSPRASGRPSVTAANKKKLSYVRDCPEILPKHERKRIQKEIDEGFKPGQGRVI